MQSRLIAGPSKSSLEASERTFAVIFDDGHEVMAGLKTSAGQQHLTASHFTGIGAFKDAMLGYFDWEKKDYEKIPIHEQVEVLSMVGDVTLKDGQPSIHAHVV